MQCSDKPGEVWDECSPVILRLERARRAEPRKPSLTHSEWELLQAFGLGTLAAIRQRMNERAMLAAYDGAPSALSEFKTDRLPVSSVPERVPYRVQVQSQPRFEDFLETRLDYDPEKLRVTVQFTVTRCVREQSVVKAPRKDPERRCYAVTFNVRDGFVIFREYGTAPESSKRFATRQDGAREADVRDR